MKARKGIGSLSDLKEAPDREPVSVIVTTYNEARNIEDCLESVLWADEILVVDSYSTDATVELAREYPVELLQREYFGSAAQKNWSMDQVKHNWVLILDADERVPEELAREILSLAIEGPKFNGYYIRRRNILLDRTIRHSGWSTDKVIRFFDKSKGRYPNRRVHTDLDISGPIPTLRNPLVHYTYRDFDQYFEKLLNYAEWGAAQGFREGTRVGFLAVAGRPTLALRTHLHLSARLPRRPARPGGLWATGGSGLSQVPTPLGSTASERRWVRRSSCPPSTKTRRPGRSRSRGLP